jgi:hypothetical protein
MRDLVTDLSDRQHMMLISEEEKAADIDRKKRNESLPANLLHGVGVGGIKTIAKMSARNYADKGDDSGKKDDWVAAKLKILECREIQSNGLSRLEKTCTGVTIAVTELRSMLESSLQLFLIYDELMSLLDAFGCLEMFQKNKKEISRGVIVKKFLTCLKRLIDNLRDEQRQKVKKEHEKAVVVRIKNSDTSSSSAERIKKSAAATMGGGGGGGSGDGGVGGGGGGVNSDSRIKRINSENNSSRANGSDSERMRNIPHIPYPSSVPSSVPSSGPSSVPESILSVSEPRIKNREKDKEKEKENEKEIRGFPTSKERGSKSRNIPVGKELVHVSNKSDALTSNAKSFTRERKRIVSSDGSNNGTNNNNNSNNNNNNNSRSSNIINNNNSNINNNNNNYTIATQSSNINTNNNNHNNQNSNSKSKLPPPPVSNRYPNPSLTPGTRALKPNITSVSRQEKSRIKGPSKYST